MYRRFRTDLAAEQRELTAGSGELTGVRAETQQRGGFDVTTVEILDEEGARSLCKPIGKYVTLGLEPLMCRTSEAFEDAAGLLAELIRGLLPADSGKGTLVAGLGNDEMTPASASLERLCRTVQLTDAGIVPGSGVGNDRAAVNQKSLGLPVLAIGVPTVVDASAFSDSPDAAGMFVTPRDIDASVRDVAKLIGYGINLALHDGLTVADIDMLKS